MLKDLWVIISMMVMRNDIAIMEHEESSPELPNKTIE